MNFDFKSQGWKHTFKMDLNELIIYCYDYNDYEIGIIRLVVDDEEKEKLRKVLK